MKKILCIFMFSLIFSSGYSQTNFDINIGIIVPQEQEIINSDALKLLDTKLKAIANHNGVSSNIWGTFIMYPIVNIISENVVEGGLRNIHIVEIEISLFVRQINNNAEFGNCNVLLNGSGDNLSNAIKNAFTKIDVKSMTYQQFLTDSKTKICKYYITNKSNIIKRANTLANLKRYDEAISLLMIYPETLDGYDDIKQASIDIYLKWQSCVCKQMIVKAESAIAIQDYTTALELLAMIDSESVCGGEALRLVKEINAQLRNKEEKHIEYINKIVGMEYELEQRRITAIKEIATNYAKHNQPQITYNQIIRF
ncbi:MAG: hypothetical protein IKJ59_08665 [Clostridia bacterium]|nr:hypothetical protein [Clostridia bacterium]